MTIRPMTRRVLPLLALLVAALVSGCGSSPSQPPASSVAINRAYNTDQSRQAFLIALRRIHAEYIEERALADLVAAGLEGLQRLEPQLLVIRDQGVSVTVRGAGFRLFEAGDRDDPIIWSARLTRAIDWIRTVSQPVVQADQETIFRTVFDGMMTRLDRFSAYRDPQSSAASRNDLHGFSGIGVTIMARDRRIVLQAITPGAPAAEGGLRAGDVVLAVDGRSTEDLSESAAADLMRGASGTSVDLTIQRGDLPPFLVRLIRAQIFNPTVAFRWETGGIGYMRITGFNERTPIMVLDQLTRARTEAGGLQGLILDLRGNPGGLFFEGVQTADMFLSSGIIVSTTSRAPGGTSTRRATGRDMANGVPIVVLIDGGTASAAEILAAALQDNGRAVVVGSRSFGKGSVQSLIYDLPNRGEIRFTSGRWLTPSNYSFDQYGIIPNLCTADDSFDVAKTLTAWRDGRLDLMAAPRQRRALSGQAGEQKVRALEGICPTSTTRREAPEEMQVAHALLADQALFRRSARPATSTARRPI
ncbi:MAG: S41 family peptidase [Alphaproteobacteria bacterium]|nr:S41 family peptidase [Alphaproteobacteria bacterium]